MKIRTKLLLALSTLPIFLIILIVSGRMQITNFNNFSETLNENYERMVLAESVHRDIKDESISLRNITLFNNEETIQSEITKIQTISDRINENIDILEELGRETEQHDLITQLKETNQEFILYKDQLIRLVNDGNKAEAVALIGEDSMEFHRDFLDLISELTTAYETRMYTSFQTESSSFSSTIVMEVIILTAIIVIIMMLLLRTNWSVSSRLNRVSNVMSGIASGKLNLNTKVEVIANNEIDEVAMSFNQMAATLEEQRDKEQNLIWIKSSIADITTSLTGAKSVEYVAETFLSKIVPLVHGNHAVFYVANENEEDSDAIFTLRASYAFKERKHMTTAFRTGEGLIGQCAREKSPIILSNVPPDYISVKSGLGEATPLNLYLLPILFEGEVRAVIEIASFEPFGEKEQILLEEMLIDLGIILESVLGRIKQTKLLEETQMLMEEIQTQSEELQSQQDELKATNEELEQQTITLKQSEEKLQSQQEELEQTNTELEEKAISLEEQNQMFEEKNKELLQARADLEEKAKQLASSSKYKSEFLANMSHELRTPLNSMLILSKLLSDNDDGALSTKQVEFAKTIYTSGKDLLALINDILDLSKIESGKMEVYPSNVVLTDLAAAVESNFKPVAGEKNLQFDIILNENLPTSIFTDEGKLQQVLKNLLGNAFKFTKKGKVTLEISQDPNATIHQSLVFSVTDTGIGIAKENLNLIFDAFQQADGTTSRKFGGTGLGLSISKELARLLGGKVVVTSEEGIGSTFSFYLRNYEAQTDTNLEFVHSKEVAATVEEKVDSQPQVGEKLEEPVVAVTEQLV
ncbi:ATP-binding protein, partial [Oceanobacillus bengalensis]